MGIFTEVWKFEVLAKLKCTLIVLTPYSNKLFRILTLSDELSSPNPLLNLFNKLLKLLKGHSSHNLLLNPSKHNSLNSK